MASHLKTRVGLVCAIAALLAPATASADPQWSRLADPPGGDAMTLVSGAPYVAYASPAGVRVVRPQPGGDTWQQVGAPIHHGAGAAVSDPTVIQAPDGRVWVAWTEADASGVRQARVARRDGTAWREVVGGARPINENIDPNRGPASASEPEIAFLDGTPYVAYLQDNPAETSISVVRLKADGSAWERIGSPGGADTRPRIVSSGGRLYLAKGERLGPAALVYRLNADKTGWESLGGLGYPDHAFFGDIADVGGTPGALFVTAEHQELTASSLDSGDAWQSIGGGPIRASDPGSPESITALGGVPYAASLQGPSEAQGVQVTYVKDGAWAQAPSPGTEGADAEMARLAAGRSGVYLLWREVAGGAEQAHVARLGEPGEPVVPPYDPGGDGSGNPIDNPVIPPGPPEPVTPAGRCSNRIVGSSLGDILTGTRGGDSIDGLAGGDRLVGYAGDDCLFGSAGNDLLAGGHGSDRVLGGRGRDLVGGGTEADTLFGGPGADELHGDRGNDDLNGGSGNDRIFAGPGQDEIGAGSGRDRIDVRGGGSDLVACGSGQDTALIDRNDATRGCEQVIVRR